MRTITARGCHGRPPRRHEPIGWLAPLLRTAGWSLVAVGSLAAVAAAAAYAAGVPERVVIGLLYVWMFAASLSAVVHLCAALTRPQPVILPMRVGRRR